MIEPTLNPPHLLTDSYPGLFIPRGAPVGPARSDAPAGLSPKADGMQSGIAVGKRSCQDEGREDAVE